MEEKYYIDINENRKIIGRYLLSFHEDKIPFSAQEVSQEVFETSIQENHNYLSGDLTTELRDIRTPEEIAEAEKLAKLPSAEEIQKNTIEIVVLDLLTEAGVL